jgi:opacity protein-like surface antigen
MRVVVFFLLAALGFVGSAAAADLDDSVIRGSDVYQPEVPVYPRWSGFYAGGQIGYATSHMDFTRATASLVTFAERDSTLLTMGIQDFPVLSTLDAQSKSYGVFFGYNSQWEGIVLGVELNYNRTSLFGSEHDSLTRRIGGGDGFIYDATVDGAASLHITDYGTLRGRVGYVVGNFLPYATIGLAAGRADVDRTATVLALKRRQDLTLVGIIGPDTDSETISKWLYGYSAGIGLDVALLPNIFVRGEWEFIQFGPFSDMRANLNALRLAAGVRF